MKFRPSYRFIALFPLLAHAPALWAAPITWGTATTMAGDTADVSTAGNKVFAYNWANASQTVNGVSFTAPGSGVTVANGSTNTGAFSSPNTTAFTTAYRAILPGAYINNGTPGTGISVTVNNLVPGHEYQVQWWSEDSRAGMGTRNTTLTSSGGNSVTLLLNPGNTANGPGQFSIGTFTADASTQVITATANVEAHLTALQVRDLTPPPLKAATGIDLTAGASWVAGEIPTSPTLATWDSTSLGAGLSMNSPQSWSGINVSGALSDIDMTGAGTLTLGTNGLSLSGVNMSIANPIALGGAETWTVVGGRTFTASGEVSRGSSNLTIAGAGTSAFSGSLTGTGSLYVEGGNATYNATGGTTGDFRIGNTSTAPTSFTMTGGDLTVSSRQLYFSENAASSGSLTQTGGTLTLVGIRGANSNSGGTPGTTINLSGGTFNSLTDAVMLTQRGTTTMTVSGTANATISQITMTGWAGSGSSTVNLDGGILTTDGIWETNGSGLGPAANGNYTTTVSLNGGILKARLDTQAANFLKFVDTALVKEGGAVIDTNGLDITLAKGLSHGGTAATDGGLTKSGGGTLTLSGANTYTGATTVNEGTLAIAPGGSFTASPSITVASGATLDASAALNLVSGQTLTGSGTLLGTLTSAAGSTVSPGIAGIGNLAVDGTLILAGNTSMDVSKTGSTITSDQITGNGAVTLGGTLTINTAGDALVLNDVIQILTNSGGVADNFAGVIVQPPLPTGLSLDTSTLATNGRVKVVNRLSSPLFSPPGGSYVGSPSVTLTSDSGTTIYYTTNGSDPTTSPNSGPSPLTITVSSNAHLYNVRAVAKKSGQPNSLISSAVYNTVGTPTWITNGDAFYWSNLPGDEANWQNAVIAGGAGMAADFSTLELTQDTSVILDGSRVIGAMKFGDASAVPQYHWSIPTYNESVLTLDGGLNQPVIEVTNQSTSISAVMTGTQGFAKTGDGTLKLAAANTYGGTTAVNAGTLLVDQGGSISAASGIDVAAGTLLHFATTSGSRTITNAISGPGDVLLSTGSAATGSNGTDVTLTGNLAAFTGKLTVDNTRVTSAQNIPGLSEIDLVIHDGAQVFANDGGPVNFTAKSITIAGRGHNASGGTGPLGALRVDNNHHFTGAVILAANAAIGGATHTGDAYVDGNISGNHELEIIPRYGNWNTKVYLAGNNTYGSTRVSGGSAAPYNGGIGELIANSATALSSGPVVVDGGRLTLNGHSFSIANLSSTASGGTVRNNHATTASTLTIGTDGSSTTYGGTFADGAAATLALTKVGAGTLTLTNANTHTGATTIDAGALLANATGSLAAGSAVAVNNTATLGGTGSVGGSIAIASTAKIAPGNAGAGTLATGNVALAGTYVCEIDGTNADRLTVTGNLDLTGAKLDVQLLTGGFTQSHYVIATCTTHTGTLPNPEGYIVKYDQGDGSNEIWLVEAGGYDAWASDNDVTGGINEDSDDDGVCNGVEYFMSQPGTGFTAMPGVVNNDGTRSVTWTKGDDYTGTYGTDFVVETSATLNGAWTQETAAPAVGSTVTITSNSVTYTFPAGPVRTFARLKVTDP